MLILTFEEFNNKFNIVNSAMSDIRVKNIGKDINLTPIEIVMRDQTPDSISEPSSQINDNNFNIIVNLHPTDGTHWVSVVRREDGPVYYFDRFGVETPPLFLEEYVDLGSNERIQQYDESYCGAYCLYMIYLIDRGFRIKSALNILVNQGKYPEIYNECFCLGCNINQGRDEVLGTPTCFTDDNDKYNVNVIDNVNVKVNDNDLQSSFAINDNDNDNDFRSSFANNVNVNDNDNDKDNVNVNVNDNDNDNDNFLYLFAEKHQRAKPNNNSPTNNIREAVSLISININDDLQSWLNDDDIITEAEFPDNLRCIISGPSECGKTFL